MPGAIPLQHFLLLHLLHSCIQIMIGAFSRYQRIMVTAFYDLPMVHNYDLISLSYSRQAVSNNYRCPPFYQRIYGMLYQLLALTVY